MVKPYLPKEKTDAPFLLVKPNGYRENIGFRRLGTVLAPSGKTRVVALFDYWTQTALKPLHTFVINHLDVWFKGTDMTMDQGAFNPLSPSGRIFSYD